MHVVSSLSLLSGTETLYFHLTHKIPLYSYGRKKPLAILLSYSISFSYCLSFSGIIDSNSLKLFFNEVLHAFNL